jgi:hypothetical protein
MHLCLVVGFGHPVIKQLILEVGYFHRIFLSPFPVCHML